MGTTAQWRQVRAVLREHRHELTEVAGRLYPGTLRAAGSGQLCRAGWLPSTPVALDEIRLSWNASPPAPVADGTGPVSADVRPARPGGGRYRTYAQAVAGLDPPALLDNRVCYRLLGARLAGSPGGCGAEVGGNEPGRPTPEMNLAQARYFDAVSLGHAVAHELAAAWHGSPGPPAMDRLPLRALAGDPCELPRRPAIPAIATLTLRRDVRGETSFILHWRDPAKVNHAGGLYQVMPVGVFQPVNGSPAAVASDLSLWRCMAREFSEEFLGGSEEYPASGGALDYRRWPFYECLAHARRAGKLTVHCLGMGVDPLTFATDILTVAVFDADVFDTAFRGLVAENAEGRVITGTARAGLPFQAGMVERVTSGTLPVQASGSAVLQLAWRHRRHLLGSL